MPKSPVSRERCGTHYSFVIFGAVQVKHSLFLFYSLVHLPWIICWLLEMFEGLVLKTGNESIRPSPTRDCGKENPERS